MRSKYVFALRTSMGGALAEDFDERTFSVGFGLGRLSG
jgi:hypothetical protein